LNRRSRAPDDHRDHASRGAPAVPGGIPGFPTS